jgi:hypothetical protein
MSIRAAVVFFWSEHSTVRREKFLKGRELRYCANKVTACSTTAEQNNPTSRGPSADRVPARRWCCIKMWPPVKRKLLHARASDVASRVASESAHALRCIIPPARIARLVAPTLKTASLVRPPLAARSMSPNTTASGILCAMSPMPSPKPVVAPAWLAAAAVHPSKRSCTQIAISKGINKPFAPGERA